MNAFLGSHQLIDNHDPYIAPYDYFAKNTIYDWFHPNGDLRELQALCGTWYVFWQGLITLPYTRDYPTLKDEICNVLRKQRAGGQPFSVVIIQPFIKTFIQKCEPQLFDDEKFKVSTKWIRAFVKFELNWSYRVATTVVGKLPEDFELQGLTMAQMYAYLIKVLTFMNILLLTVIKLIFIWYLHDEQEREILRRLSK